MRQLLHPFAVLALLFVVSDGRADDLDDFIQGQLKKRQVPGLSIAIIQDGKIVKARGYGFIDKSGSTPVATTTLFQAGSISKSVSAVGALHLTELGKLDLDENVNVKLKSWKVPENEFTKEKKVTLRGLLSHTTGLTVHGFPGYEVGTPIPTVVQVLDGASPANTAPVRVDFVPGTHWRYSGGGYTVMQQLLLDVTGKPFPAFMQEAVLGPLNMTESTYEQPLPAAKAKLTATGYYGDRNLVKGRWHIYPEMAAAGLWTTPADLARFAIGIQNALAGKPGAVLSQEMTRQMLTNQKDNDGLGVFLQGEGHTLRFSHGGRDEGFDALLVAGAETGQGVIIMINANDNSQMMNRIADAVAKKYKWTGLTGVDNALSAPVKPTAANVDSQILTAYEGRYELSNNRIITFMADNGRLVTLVDGLPDEEFIPESATHFVSGDASLTFSPNEKGSITDLVWKQGKDERKIPRIGPLFRTIKPVADPAPARTRQLKTTLAAIAAGSENLEKTPGITSNARRDFASGAPELSGINSITFVAAQDVSGRGIERHEGKVSQVLHYKVLTNKGPRFLLLHLTSDGLLTDYDIVEQ